jgi:hypothetical protein
MKFHEYLAKRDGISLKEAARRSLARSWELAQTGKVMALITAFIQGSAYKQNIARNSMLASNIREAKFGYTPLYSYWLYEETDPKTSVVTKKKVQEDSFLVSAPVLIPNKEFRTIVLSWIQKYHQEAAVIKYADTDIANLLMANGTESQLGHWSVNRLAEIYSQMKHGVNTPARSFVFEAADDHSWSTKLAIQTVGKKD